MIAVAEIHTTRRVSHGLPAALLLFVASMIVPADFAFEIWGLRLDPQRLVLLGAAWGVFVWIHTTRDLRPWDVCLILAALWAVAATFLHMPFGAAIERGGSFFLETAIAYLLPSAFLINPAQVRTLIRGFFIVVAVLAVLAGMEATIGEHLISDWAADLMDKPKPFEAEERLGLLRARVSFSHQILFGIFCASLFSFFWFEAASQLGRILRTVVCGIAVFFSLSSAAYLLFILQLAMIWVEAATRNVKNRLQVFLMGGAIGWILIELVVNGGITGFVTRYLSLNPSTAYYRQLIWQHIIDDISANPILGTGGVWSRPSWMVTSIDHFYFAKAIFYGTGPVILMMVTAVLIGRQLWRRTAETGTAHWCFRFSWVFCVLGLAIAGLTVDYFGRALPFTMFILGLGAAWVRLLDDPRGGH